jgi:hypothetical protein
MFTLTFTLAIVYVTVPVFDPSLAALMPRHAHRDSD